MIKLSNNELKAIVGGVVDVDVASIFDKLIEHSSKHGDEYHFSGHGVDLVMTANLFHAISDHKSAIVDDLKDYYKKYYFVHPSTVEVILNIVGLEAEKDPHYGYSYSDSDYNASVL